MPILTYHKLLKTAEPPIRAYEQSAGWDLSAHLLNDAERPFTLTLAPRTAQRIKTGLSLQASRGHMILICSRSGLATRGIFVANAPGVVDPDYIGEIEVILFNGSTEPHYVKHKDRIAQAVVIPLPACDLTEQPQPFSETGRGAKGFGSSGI